MHREISIVLYHHISSERDGFTSNLGDTIAPDLFEQHVRYFAGHFDLIAPADLISGRLPRRPLLVTFDDAYRSVLEVAGPILKSVSAPSLFFLNPATIESTCLALPNVLSVATEELGFEAVLAAFNADGRGITSTGALIATLVPTMRLAEINEVKQRLFARMGVTEAELRRSSNLFLSPGNLSRFDDYGIVVGNHSTSHQFLRALSPDELEGEITGASAALRRLTGQPVSYFSVPYGNEADAGASVLALARASGHRAIFLVHDRSNRFRPAADVYYRVDLGSTLPEHIPAKLLWRPLLRTVRNWTR
jgi:peptidoglycan/xylan/chitin deacetylase (PgdA/CDA1 family)